MTSVVFAQQRDRDNYSAFLNRLVQHIEVAAKDSIAYSIPQTQNEAIIFYALDYSKETSPGFIKLLNRIQSLSSSDGHVLSLYLYNCQFVDGYFAEDYFNDIQVIAGKGELFSAKHYLNLIRPKLLDCLRFVKNSAIKILLNFYSPTPLTAVLS